MALETGLRWNEIVTLTRNNFILLDKPYVRVGAANAKNGKDDILPLSAEVVVNLSTYFNQKAATPLAKAFTGIWQKRGWEMLEVDLKAADIITCNEADEVLDFHLLRHTCGTRLARAGVQPQLAQRIMRHSNVNLTLKYYTHLALEDKRGAIEKLPSIGSVSVENCMKPDVPSAKTDTETDTNGCPFSDYLSHLVSQSIRDINKNSEAFPVVNKTATPELTVGCSLEIIGARKGARTLDLQIHNLTL